MPPPKREYPANISVSHINVRQSISFLLIKLVLLEMIAAALMLLLFVPVSFLPGVSDSSISSMQLMLYIFLALVKSGLSLTVVVKWMNEYYEIMPDRVVYRSGIIYKKARHYTFNHIMSVEIKQSILGRMFNYANIHMYDRYINKDVYLYLIHNPNRYFKILKNLIPDADIREEKILNGVTEVED